MRALVLFQLIVGIACYAQQAKRADSTGYLRGPFVLKSPASLGPGFLGHDIRSVIAALEKASPGPKSEFETTEHYETRVASFMGAQQQYVFVNDPVADAHPVDDYNNAGAFVYDADGQAVTRTIKLSSYGSGRFVLRSSTTAAGQYVGSNAFGVHTLVHRYIKNVYGISIRDRGDLIETENICANVPDCHMDGDWFIRIRVPMEPTEAMALKDSLRIALVCTVSGSEITRDDQLTEATVSEPREIQWHDRALPVRLDKLWVFERRTGRILLTLGGAPGQ